jgi:SPP1 family predicted phage head-tail adaptor
MLAGRLRDRITIQARPTTKDAAGLRSGAWANVGFLVAVPAWVEELQGNELINAQALVAEVTIRVTIRGYLNWRSDIKPECRVLFGTRVFDIKDALNPDGRNREIEMMCTEIVA